MRIGEVNELQILRFASSGAYLGDEEGNDVLLPGQYLNEDMKVDDKINVFLYRDSEDRLVATTQTPLIELNGFAHLKVVSVTLFGAFVDWGLEKDLMIPFREQNLKLEEGNTYLVCLLLDEATDRLYGSTKISKHLQPCEIPYDPETEVDLLICDRSDLGLKVVVDNRYSGLIYTNDITKPLRSGDHAKGYVYNVREDGKLDVRFDLTGGKKILDSADQLLEILKTVKKLPLHDKSSPEDIRDRLGMSKKTFKQAVGTLYKRREIILTNDGIEIAQRRRIKEQRLKIVRFQILDAGQIILNTRFVFDLLSYVLRPISIKKKDSRFWTLDRSFSIHDSSLIFHLMSFIRFSIKKKILDSGRQTDHSQYTIRL